MITSSGNPRIKYVRSLSARKIREKEKKFIVEGIHLVEEALNAPDFKIDYALFTKKLTKTAEGEKLLREMVKNNCEALEVPEKIMSEISDVETPQGIVAVVGIKEDNIDDLAREKDPLVIVCAGIQDPGNLGTILRSADSFGACGVLYGSGSADIYNPKTVRSSMGSIFHLPIVYFDDVRVGLKRLKERGLKLVATSLHGSSPLSETDLKGGSVIVLGAEGTGLPSDVVKMCDISVRIPMKGNAESLNVAVAGSIILYEAMRQRMRNA